MWVVQLMQEAMAGRTMTNRITCKIQGLDCAEEVTILRKALEGKEGIDALGFDLLASKMTVRYDPARLDPEEILALVASTGMKAIPWDTGDKAKKGFSWEERGPLIVTCISGAALVGGFLSHWLYHGGILHALASGGGKEHTYPLTSVVFYVLASVSGAWFVLPKALKAAKNVRPDMNLLMSTAIAGAMGIGEWFEAGAVAFLFALALLLEHWSIARAHRAVTALMDLSPDTARYLSPGEGAIVERQVEEVPVGVTVLVRPGEKIPLDGEVTKGSSTVNQASITGESIPVAKILGDPVFAGTINEDGSLEFRVTKAARDTTLARVIRLVEEARLRRAPTEQWVDKFARYYTPAMMMGALAVGLVPPLLFSGSWAEWLYRGLVILVIACPCALVISTPVSIVSGLTAAARSGVLVKGGMYLEVPGRLQGLALDKTGTLTWGRPEVQEIVPLNGHSPKELLERAAALEAHSDHPLARAILRRAEAEEITPLSAENFQAIRGKGARAEVGGRLFWIGSHRLMHEMGEETPEVHDKAEELQQSGCSVVSIGNEEHVCGLISVGDSVREEAAEAVRQIKQLGVRRVVMLTGDNEGTARAVASETGIDEFMAELLPEDKVGVVRSLVDELGGVGMVGDGVNDAPAMAAATLGIAMGVAGTDAAIETADVALMSDDLRRLPWLVRHSRRTLAIIKQNIAFAVGVKFLFMLLAVVGFASLWMAIAADMGASLLVISNGMRLLRTRTEE
jgi:Cd2+/Zn2+-exporting ATPase